MDRRKVEDDGPVSRRKYGMYRGTLDAKRRMSEEKQERAKLVNAYNHLAFVMFKKNGKGPAVDTLLNGDDDGNTQWTCETCKQGIWMRIRRAQCPLCRKYHHKVCITGKVLLIKPISELEAREQPPPRRVAMNVPVCAKCEAAIEAVRRISQFRQAFSKQRKVDIFYALFSKLKANIEASLHNFGLFVKTFVEHEFHAKRSSYVECQSVYQTLASLFDSFTKAMKRLVETKFETRRDEGVASGMRSALAEWVMERMSQFRALEGQWKKVKVVADPVAGEAPLPAPPRRAESMLLDNMVAGSPHPLARANTAPPFSLPTPVGRPPSTSKEPTPQPSPRPGSFVAPPPSSPRPEPAPAKRLSREARMSAEPLRTGERLGAITVAEINPLVCPTKKKTRMTISGNHFDKNVGVRIGGVDCVCQVMNSVLIIAECPPLVEEGQKDVEVYDLTGERESVVLPGMITYMEQTWTTEAEVVDAFLDEDSDEWNEQDLLADLPRREVTITSLDPVISPLRGTMMSLTGTGIDSSCTVLVDGVDCDRVEVAPASSAEGGPVRVSFRSPSLLEGGFKRVEVVNPRDGSRGHLDNVLVYHDL